MEILFKQTAFRATSFADSSVHTDCCSSLSCEVPLKPCACCAMTIGAKTGFDSIEETLMTLTASTNWDVTACGAATATASSLGFDS